MTAETQALTPLAPGLLVAAPTMNDPRFARAVILLAEAGDDGAMGFLLTAETEFTYSEVGEHLELDVADAVATRAVLHGGPVSPERGWLVYDTRDTPVDDAADAIELSATLSVTGAVDALRQLLMSGDDGGAVGRFEFFLGYAGWSENQLEEEIAEGVWLPAALDESLVFSTDRAALWERALRQLDLDIGTFMMGAGGDA